MPKMDYILIAVVGVLLLLGIIILAGVSSALSQERFGSPGVFLLRHLLFGLMPGLILGFLAFMTPISFFKKWAPISLLISLFLMILVFVPKIGLSFGGAKRWINLGFISFQPSEFLKLSFFLYLPALLSRCVKGFSKTFIAFLVIIFLIGLLLILQSDASTLGIIVLTALLIYFLAGSPIKHNFLIILAGMAGLAALIKFEPYRLNRLLTFIKPDIDPMGISYQIKQSLITVGSGGFWGKGLGMSIQKFGFLPQPMADSIFAVFSEETGFIGSFVLISLFLIFAWQGFKIAKRSRDKFSQLTSFGISFWIIIQAFVNIGAMVGILPITGIPLPFISYGGSALIVELIGVGILLNISKNT